MKGALAVAIHIVKVNHSIEEIQLTGTTPRHHLALEKGQP